MEPTSKYEPVRFRDIPTRSLIVAALSLLVGLAISVLVFATDFQHRAMLGVLLPVQLAAFVLGVWSMVSGIRQAGRATGTR